MKLQLKSLGLRDYSTVWVEMREFTDTRQEQTADQLWLVEHPPVYTLGLNGDPRHILGPVSAPVVQTDRGGQVTYHGPGQLVVYTLLDLRRLGIGIRTLVSGLENAAVGALSQYGLQAAARRDAPGVYVEGKKIASLGLRVRRGCSYHGLSLNVDMDLSPFSAINPCGYRGLEVTQLVDFDIHIQPLEIAIPLVRKIMQEFGYDDIDASP